MNVLVSGMVAHVSVRAMLSSTKDEVEGRRRSNRQKAAILYSPLIHIEADLGYSKSGYEYMADSVTSACDHARSIYWSVHTTITTYMLHVTPAVSQRDRDCYVRH